MIFKDKTAIVTGGSEGVGAAVARLFAEALSLLMALFLSVQELQPYRIIKRISVSPLTTSRFAFFLLFSVIY